MQLGPVFLGKDMQVGTSCSASSISDARLRTSGRI
jgi:hypothetical protein